MIDKAMNNKARIKTNMRRLLTAALAASTLLLGGNALADGMAARTSDISAATRGKLLADIQAYRQSNPGAFAAVRDVQGYRPETYRKFRNPVPLVGRELRRLGKKALLPMLNALAFEAPSLAGVSEREQRALVVGMLEAVGKLRDPRSAEVVRAAFERQDQPDISQSAAEALGQLCDDGSLTVLTEALQKNKRRAAIHGLGQCRRVEAAKTLVALLGQSTSASDAENIAAAMGRLGSSWAWRALGASRADEGLAVRTLMTEALVRSYSRFGAAAAQAAHRRSLTMIEHPQLRDIVAQQTGPASPHRGLDAVVKRVEKRVRR